MCYAILECVELYNKDTRELPKFRLSYKEKSWEFREHHMGSASTMARYLLDIFVFGREIRYWTKDIDDRRIKYKWRE